MSTTKRVGLAEHKSTISQSTVLLLLALFVAFLAAWPLIGEPGFLNTRGGGDSPFLLQRLQQMESALRDGHFPVRWMPDANYGYGYPFYNFYAPLSIYIAALFRFLGFPIVRSVELAQLAGFLAAAWGMFLLARRWLASEWAGLLASVAYTVAPFHMVNIYVRGDSLAEFWAMAWYPWVLLAADRLFDRKVAGFPYGAATALALTYAALILSHNISALVFSPFLLLFVLLRWLYTYKASRRDGDALADHALGNQILPLFVALLLALGLSAWFFLPALAEQDLAQLGPVTEGYFHYSNHFRGADLLQTSFLFDYGVGGGNAFRMGLVQGLAALLGMIALLYATIRKRLVAVPITLFVLLSLLIATFMLTPLSRFLWDNLPLLPFTQFPWRFLSVQAFFAALATGALGLLPLRRLWVPLTAVLLVAAGLVGLQTDHLLLTAEDITSERLASYEWFTGNIGSTVSAEYLPPTVQPRAYSSSWLSSGERTAVRALSGDLLETQLLEERSTQQTWMVRTSESEATLMFPTMQWPGWTAEVDGKAVQIQPAPGSGLITLDVPPGENLVTLRLTRTPLRLAAELLSLAALIVTLLLVFRTISRPQLERPALIIAGLLLTFLVIFRFWPESPGTVQDLTWDLAQMGYLHHDTAGVSFDNGTILERYDYDHQSIAAGETLAVTLELSGAVGQEVTVALGTPAIGWPIFDPQPPLIASQSKSTTSGSTRFELALPENVPAGLVVPRVTINGAQPLMPSGQTRGDIYLRPLLVENEAAAHVDSALLDVRAVNVQQRDETTLDVQLAWHTGVQLSHNYNASLRLIDGDGNWLAQMDTQPGYGFLPSSEWPVGVEVNDWLALTLPQELPEGSRLTLLANLYEIPLGDVVMTRRLGRMFVQDGRFLFHENEALFELPQDLTPATAVFGDLIRLQAYELEESEDQIRLTFYWQPAAAGQEDYTRFVHLIDPTTGQILAQNDGYPQNNSYPTSQWIPGEIVSDTLVFDLTDGVPDTYQVGVGFYRQEGESILRLTAVDGVTAVPYDDDRVPLFGP